MRVNSATNMSHYFTLPNNRLRAYLGRVVSGSESVIRSPFYEGRNIHAVLESWLDILDSKLERWPSLFAFERDLANKVGPLSVMKPLEERWPDIESYYDSILTSQAPILDAAMGRTLAEWSACMGLRAKSYIRTLDGMKKSTSSGNPYFRKKRDVIQDTFPMSIEYDRKKLEIVQHLPSGSWDACAILGWRGQEGGPNPQDVKQRVVWMFPFAVNVAELSVYQPLISAAQRKHIVPAWISLDAVDQVVTRLFDTKGSKDIILCTDFTKFDQHFNPTMQECAEIILGTLLTQESASRCWLEHIFPIKYNIPLLVDWGTMITGRHGMGSGSGGTNADETLVHRTLQHEAAIKAGTILNPNSQCLGDDGILSFNGISTEDVVDTYTSHGLSMNPSKQYESREDCIYLRRYYHNRYRIGGICRGIYSTCRALGRLAYQERFYSPDVWGEKAVVLRYLSILENVKWHPCRELFVDFCMKGDKTRLGLDIPGFFDSDQLLNSFENLKRYMPDFFGYTRNQELESGHSTSINDWWVVNYLKSKA